jgi:hypothetical protein
MPTEKVEVGFDLTANGGPFLVLDDAISGQLDDPDWTLGGTVFVDITDYVTSIQITRGKSNFIDTFSSGEAIVELNNRTRAFDPTYTASPFYGNILPKREVRISSNGIRQYSGSIDDWNLQYSADGNALANFVCSDGFVYLNNQTLVGGTATSQLSGARVSAILDDPTVAWPSAARHIDTGATLLGADVIEPDTNALTYLRLVESSENGRLFIDKSGNLTFLDRTVAPVSSGVVRLADDGTGIAYQNLQIMYGSEELANEVVVSSIITSTTVTVNDTDSQNAYGIFNLTKADLIIANDTESMNLAMFLAQKYSQPQYRFDSVDVRVNDLSLANQNAVLGLEIGDVVEIKFTPSGIPPAIVKYAEVIRANHSVDINGEHIINLGFDTLDYTYFVLDDIAFGILDSGNALSW